MNVNWAIRHELRKRKMTGPKLAKATGWSLGRSHMMLNESAPGGMNVSTLETLAEALNLDIKLVPRETNQNPS